MFGFRRATRNERASAMVEFAVVLPLLLIVFTGVAEFGIAFKQKLAVSNAVQTATRTGSSLGQNPAADMAILDSIQQGFSSLPGNGDALVTKVTVYKADASGNVQDGEINTYLYLPGGSCDWDPCPTDESNFGTNPWLPSEREVEVGSLDNMGVTIYYGHDWVLGGYGFLPDLPCNTDDSQCWTESAVLRLEPVNS